MLSLWSARGVPGATGNTGSAGAAGAAGINGALIWTKYTVGFAALSAAAVTNDIELFSLAAKTMIHSVVIKQSTAFSGGLIATYTISVGISGNLVKYGVAFNTFQAAGATVFGMNNLPGIESFTGATSIRIAAVSTIGNLSAATSGSVDVWALTSLLP